VVRRILSLASRLWRDEQTGPGFQSSRLIQCSVIRIRASLTRCRVAEQTLLFSSWRTHLVSMALFKVNTGPARTGSRDLAGNGNLGFRSRHFDLRHSTDFVKNALDRYVVLNGIARSVVNECRGGHPESL